MKPTRLLFFAAAIAGLLFLVWLRLYQPPNTVDDAYITFRYARNIASGVGFVYNEGDRVQGTTTPAFALLLAGLSRLTGYYDYPRLALVVNALLNAVIFCLLAALVRLLVRGVVPRARGARIPTRWLGLGAGLLFAVEGRALDFSTGGMESSLNVLAVVLTLTLFLARYTRWAALALGLAVLVRPDGLTLAAVFFGALGLEALLRRRQWPWAEAALFAMVVVPWLLFALLYFGNPIPQSILAKSELYRTPELMAFRAFLVQLRTLFPFSLPPLQDPEPLHRQLLQAALPAALISLGLAAAQRYNPRAWVVGAYMLLFIAFYSVGNPLWLGWYEIPMMPLYQALILTAAAWVGVQLTRPIHRWLPQARTWAVYGLGLAAVTTMLLPHLSRLNLLPWEPRQLPAFTLNAAFNKRREADYMLLARMLQPAADQQRLVAIPEIGAFGYVYPGTLFDTSGLISPPMLKYFPIPEHIPVEIYSIPREMIFDLRPDVFISFDSFMQATLPPDDPEFLALYRPTIGLTSHAAFGVQRLVTYRRADLPLEVTLPPGAQPAEAVFGAGEGLVRLAGHSVRPWSDLADDYAEVTLFWRGPQAPVDRELLVRVNLLGANGELVYQVLDYLGEGLFPPSSWTPDMWLVDRIQLKRPRPGAGPYTVTVTVFTSDADDALPATSGGAPLTEDSYLLGPVELP